jgi:DNA-directed RNA polymerase specialized sigma24 family protein
MNSPDQPSTVAQSFLETIARLRDRDERAAAELVERFGPQLRRIARFQLGRTGLERCLESMDVCQSVMAVFFQRLTAGELDLETPEQILALLRVMVRNCVFDKCDYFHAARRDVSRLQAEAIETVGIAADGSRASVIVSRDELRGRIQALLSESERWLLEQRESGRTWPDIGSERGMSGSAARKQFARIRERIASQLGLEDSRS